MMEARVVTHIGHYPAPALPRGFSYRAHHGLEAKAFPGVQPACIVMDVPSPPNHIRVVIGFDIRRTHVEWWFTDSSFSADWVDTRYHRVGPRIADVLHKELSRLWLLL